MVQMAWVVVTVLVDIGQLTSDTAHCRPSIVILARSRPTSKLRIRHALADPGEIDRTMAIGVMRRIRNALNIE